MIKIYRPINDIHRQLVVCK